MNTVIDNWLAIAIIATNTEGRESESRRGASFLERLEQALAWAGAPEKGLKHGVAWVMRLGRFLGTRMFYGAGPDDVEALYRQLVAEHMESGSLEGVRRLPAATGGVLEGSAGVRLPPIFYGIIPGSDQSCKGLGLTDEDQRVATVLTW